MRRRIFIFFMVGIMVALCALTTYAQAEKPPVQFYFVEDNVVKPSKMNQFEAAVKEFLAMIEEYHFPYSFYTYMTDDFHYYFVYPIEGFSDLEKAYQIWSEILAKFGEDKWQAINKRMGKTIEYFKHGTFIQQPALSYTPQGHQLSLEKVPYTYWGFAYGKPGLEKELEANLKEWVALYESRKIPVGFTTFVGGIGTDMPFYFWTMRAKNAAEYWRLDEKIVEELGPEKVMALWNKTLALLRKYEYKTGLFRPDLSYLPKESK